jgi:hypothetical protein
VEQQDHQHQQVQLVVEDQIQYFHQLHQQVEEEVNIDQMLQTILQVDLVQEEQQVIQQQQEQEIHLQ